MKAKIFLISYRFLLLSLLSCLIFVSACQKQEAASTPTTLATESLDTEELELSFTDLGQYNTGISGRMYQLKKPALVAITQLEEVAFVSGWVQSESQEQLNKLDYEGVFVVAAFQGFKSTSGYEIQIKRVTSQSGIVQVYGQYIEPEPGTTAVRGDTSPYHLIQIPKSSATAGLSEFSLIIDEAVVAKHFTSSKSHLAFATIDQYESGGMSSKYNADAPALVAITKPEDIARLVDWVQLEQQERLHLVNFDKFFVLAVFQGTKPNTGYGIQVELIKFDDGRVSVFSQFIEPDPNTTVGSTESSPYHLVQVLKPTDWREKIIFDLLSEGVFIVSYVTDTPSDSQ